MNMKIYSLGFIMLIKTACVRKHDLASYKWEKMQIIQHAKEIFS